ncbi:Uncharacterized conserved protein [Janthinobacterium sp. Marseille]|nr:O-antigen polymerase [Janthinobacterium sp. Marseille]ABR91661.1 Uncharacterized conserved protein [Janthinobacterium sp. Marseille]
MNYSGLFFIVLCAYLPGLILLACFPKVWKFPIPNFAFIGMFLFNAVGSAGVFNDQKIYTIIFDSFEVAQDLALLLILQAILYYLIVIPYWFLRRPESFFATPNRQDSIAIFLGLSAIVLIASLYFNEVGTFPVLHALDGSMNVDTAFQYRKNLVYGLAHWPFYNLGFVFLPVFISNYIFLKARFYETINWWSCAAIFVCFSASLLLGSKAGVINFVLTLSITYVVYISRDGLSLKKFAINKNFLLFVVIAFLIMIFGYINATPDQLTITTLLERLWYRVFVTYPETIAGAISYAKQNDFLGMGVFPTMRGIFTHERVILSTELHQYMAGAPGGMNVAFVAEAYISYGWAGVLILCPLIYFFLIFLQEIAFRLRSGIFALAFTSFYSYMAILLSVIGMFSTLFTFMYPIAIAILFFTAWITERIFFPKLRLNTL